MLIQIFSPVENRKSERIEFEGVRSMLEDLAMEMQRALEDM